tara:strand:+ start:808 stop:2265 length:1458 start_codon:yes stop_codon:yes gene_type:complete
LEIKPNIKNFSKKILSKKYNRFCIWGEITADLETPITAYLKLIKKNSNNFLLESVEGGSSRGRYSIIGIEADKILKCVATNKENLNNLKKEISNLKTCTFGNLPSMVSSYVGYMGYDFIRFYEDLPHENKDSLNIPKALFMRTSLVAVFDNLRNTICIVNTINKPTKKLNKKLIKNLYNESKKKITNIINNLTKPLKIKKNSFKKVKKKEKISCNMSKKQYYNVVSNIKKYINEGDVIQVVPSLRFEKKFKQKPFSLYRSLRKLNPSPFLFILNFKNFSLVGSSPEILVRLKEDKITIRPIAGTRKRGRDEREDKKLAKDLLSDPKEIAEHLMLLDLGRNDVGRVSVKNSVKVTEKMIIENYSHVMHIVSNVVGKLNKKYHPLDVLAAGFPAGTVTGAPKIRAMEIINEVENISRSFYAGGVGYFAHDGSLDTCITLRTGMIKNNTLFVQSGGGVVSDSNHLNEYNEIINKAKAVLNASEDAENF